MGLVEDQNNRRILRKRRILGLMAALAVGLLCSLAWIIVVSNVLILFGWIFSIVISALLVITVSEVYRHFAKEHAFFDFFASVLLSVLLLFLSSLIAYSPTALNWACHEYGSVIIDNSNYLSTYMWMILGSLSNPIYQSSFFMFSFTTALGVVIGAIYLFRSGKYN